MKFRSHVDLSGLGNTGKGIVSDYLMEFSDVYVPRKDLEFNLLRAPGGLMDMHYSLVKCWSPIRADDAVNRFTKLVMRLAARVKFCNPKELTNAAGYRYEDFYPGFIELSEDFLSDIISFRYRGLWPYRDYHSEMVQMLFKRISSKFNRNNILEEISFCDGDEFENKLKTYVYDVLSLALKDKRNVYVTHNALEPFEAYRYLSLLTRSKMIVVKRDPRDTYTNIIHGNNAKSGFYKRMDPTFYNISASSNLENFISYQRKMLSALNNVHHPNLFIIDFNDFILNYEEVSSRLNLFLGLKSENHVDQYKYFDPRISRRNVGIYKRPDLASSIQQIEEGLSDLWDFNSKANTVDPE